MKQNETETLLNLRENNSDRRRAISNALLQITATKVFVVLSITAAFVWICVFTFANFKDGMARSHMIADCIVCMILLIVPIIRMKYLESDPRFKEVIEDAHQFKHESDTLMNALKVLPCYDDLRPQLFDPKLQAKSYLDVNADARYTSLSRAFISTLFIIAGQQIGETTKRRHYAAIAAHQRDAKEAKEKEIELCNTFQEVFGLCKKHRIIPAKLPDKLFTTCRDSTQVIEEYWKA